MSFMTIVYINTIEKLSFNIAHVRIISLMKCGNNRNAFLYDNSFKKTKEILCIKFSKTDGIEMKSQHWSGNIKLSMKGIAVEYFQIQLTKVEMKKNHNFINI